ncbi:hypothetical protein TTHERM_00918460 (macronuclear) [Tetrahymena thermophila SB210]|uniref:Uncharacterized protein n=1 Tax=Tetrahymena thermophila (strain SB210) TaxID=312017 RepID=Q24IM9_TETTS|nr:hypothetical protein TTHERM_00918460 [Tetrahymena thermophila SB210]EAS07596.3 hypothetical protein TTHERM_00918460 [Tetrahymena thermophila SB210]|eukprot:XP_001027838.3 hypothetical protein TTHERM_00918460 [Tetrahymena thermophila SB210]
MDVQENLSQNQQVNYFKSKLTDLKQFKKQLEEAYNDKSTTYLQKNDKFFAIINDYKQQLEDIQKIIEEDIVNVNAPNIPEELIKRQDQDQSIKEYMQERKELVKKSIDGQKEKLQFIQNFTNEFEKSLKEYKILPDS